ncbi:MAG: DUF4290 domain-containing protein [Flavobacteriales bacterium]|nr:DUF4290 domain-containing protein [Flavobacteriales bacterium]
MQETRPLHLEYNSERQDLIIPEYGRNVHRMIDYCLTVADREERNKVAQAIISVMGQLCPHLRDIDDFKHKLWDHLHIMSHFQLDVDSEYEKPKPDQFEEPPQRLTYPDGNFRYGHYGKYTERLIDKVANYEEGPERDAFALAVANLMKKHYLTWNRKTVEDETILKQLDELSKGKVKLKEGQTLIGSQELISKARVVAPLRKTNKPKMKKKKR